MAKAKVIFQKAIMKARLGVFIIVAFYQKVFADSSLVTDLASKLLSPFKSDQSAAQDELNIETQKQLSDAGDIADNAVFQTIKELSNFGDVTELHSLVIGLSKEELPVINEFLSFALNAVQEDSSNFTDALQIAFNFGRFLADSGQVSDSQLLALNKLLQDASSAVDVFNYVAAFLRSLSDDASIEDVAQIEYQATKNDSASFVDSVVVLLFQGVYLSDSAGLIDALQVQLILGRNEAASLADEIANKAINKVISEQLYSTDDFDGASSVDDDQNMEFIKSRTELGFVGESIVNLVAKTATDTTSTNDSGTVTTQTYALEDYFLQEYCGFVRNF